MAILVNNLLKKRLKKQKKFTKIDKLLVTSQMAVG